MRFVLYQYIVVGGLFPTLVFGSNKLFQRYPSLDGNVCGPADLLLVNISPTLLFCSVLCKTEGKCVSLFYMEGNRTCYGCAKSYSDVDGSGLVGGAFTKYYSESNLAPATTTTTTTTATTPTSITTSSSTTTPSSTTSTTATISTTSATTTSTSHPIIPGWQFFQESYYRLEDASLSYSLAQAACAGNGANLVHVSSEAENTFIGDIVETALGTNYKIYIGASRTVATWRWEDDGSLFTYHNWRGGVEHSTAGQDCAAMVRDALGDKEWMDVYCYMSRRFVCEK